MNYRTILASSVVALGVAGLPFLAAAQETTTSTQGVSATTVVTATISSTQTAPLTPKPALLRERALMNSTASTTLKREIEEGRPTLGLPLRPKAPEARMNASTTAARAEMQAEKKRAIEQHRTDVLAKAQERAHQEIDRRVAALEAFAERIGNARMSDADKEALKATMHDQIASLTSLKSGIENDTSTSTIKEAVKSINKSYRVFALVMPKGAIIAAADRVKQVVSQMQQFSTKLGARITAAQTAGNDTASLSTLLADLDAKVADAQAQAQAAVDQVNALSPDNGDDAVFKANKSALQEAHKKLQAAQQDLVQARKDAESIVKGIRSFGSTETTATSTTTVQDTASTTSTTTAQ